MITMEEVVMIPLPSDLEELSPSSPLLAADVFLLCFSISDHASLYTALDQWLPLLKVVLKIVVVIRMEIENMLNGFWSESDFKS